MARLFYNFRSLIILDLSNLNISSVAIMFNILFNCSLLELNNLTNFNTSLVIGMANKFENVKN